MITLLIIDDSTADQFYCEHIIDMAEHDITVLKAFDGREALELLDSLDSPPDGILLDVNMPGMNGHEFLAAYSEQNTRESPVIMMLTSSDQTTDQEKAKAYKCVKDYMVKPLTVDKVSALANEILGIPTAA